MFSEKMAPLKCIVIRTMLYIYLARFLPSYYMEESVNHSLSVWLEQHTSPNNKEIYFPDLFTYS